MTDHDLSAYIPSLRKEVERKYGHRVATSTDFARLARHIAADKAGSVSESTLKRLWGYVADNYSSRRVSTLDNLARYAGHADFNAYVKSLNGEDANVSGYNSDTSLDVASLSQGSLVEISWHPNRRIVARYLGDLAFVIESSENAKLAPGMHVRCLTLVKGQQMILNVIRPDANGESRAYVAGKINGIDWQIIG